MKRLVISEIHDEPFSNFSYLYKRTEFLAVHGSPCFWKLGKSGEIGKSQTISKEEK
jgi:hypothetical protein